MTSYSKKHSMNSTKKTSKIAIHHGRAAKKILVSRVPQFNAF